jgi:hypothetical protein
MPIAFVLVSGYGASMEPGALPDPTPGAVLEVTKDDVCTVGYAQERAKRPGGCEASGL